MPTSPDSESPDSNLIDSFFVYGTLCRGQCRERCWPHPPIAVTPGWVCGALYGRSDYPALTVGDDRVQGELWQFERVYLAEVLKVIDAVEGTHQPGTANLYDRVVVEVYRSDSIDQSEITSDDCIGKAWGYHYATPPELDGFVRIRPNVTQCVRWPPA